MVRADGACAARSGESDRTARTEQGTIEVDTVVILTAIAVEAAARPVERHGCCCHTAANENAKLIAPCAQRARSQEKRIVRGAT